MTHRSVFFVSDGTGITAETLGNTLLTQFDGLEVEKTTLPFINSAERARSIVEGNGGIVRRRDDHLMCIEIAADAVWKLCVLPLSFLGTTGDRLVYSIDLSAMGLPVFDG